MRLLTTILTKRVGLFGSLGLFVLALACQTQKGSDPVPNPPSSGGGVVYQTTPYTLRKPANFPTMVYDLSQNPLTIEGVSLGKPCFMIPPCRVIRRLAAGFATSSLPVSDTPTMR